MRKMIIISIFVGVLCALPISTKAALYFELDATTAAGMRDLSFSGGGDSYSLDYVGYNPGTDSALYPVGDKVYGTWGNYGDNMVYEVGFGGSIHAGETDINGEADLTIGLYNASGLGFSGTTFDGFLLPLSNDNDDTWSYQAYVIYNLGAGEVTVDSGAFVDLVKDTQTTLIVPTFAGLDYSKVVGIGFTIKWKNVNNPATEAEGGGYRTGDEFHTSIVPIPGAVLLGLLGIGVAGLKLRRFA